MSFAADPGRTIAPSIPVLSPPGGLRVRTTRSLVPRPSHARPRRCGSPSSCSAASCRAPSAARSATSSTCPTSSPRPASTSSTQNFGGQGTGIVGTIVFRADQGVDDPAVQEAMEAPVRRGRDDSKTSSGSRAPTPRAATARSSSTGPDAGKIAYANVEMPDDIAFARAGEIRDEILDEHARRSTALDIELGGFIFAEFEEPVVRGARPRLRHRHPHPGVRLGAGHGPARRRRAVRHRHRHRDHHVAQQPPHDPRLRHVPRHHDRPRRRHRLRAADRHPVPRAAARGPHRARVDRRSPSTPPAGRCCSPASPS